MSGYDPRPSAHADPKRQPAQTLPPFALADLVGSARIQLVDLGIQCLKRALPLRLRHPGAMHRARELSGGSGCAAPALARRALLASLDERQRRAILARTMADAAAGPLELQTLTDLAPLLGNPAVSPK